MAYSHEIKGQAGGAIIVDPAKSSPEYEDSFTCGHCGSVVWCKPFKSAEAMGGRCTCCDKLICLKCVGKGCSPLQKKLELWERRRQNQEAFS